MANRTLPEARRYPGVMISSTFLDLEQHRAALIKAIKAQGLTDVGMENDLARADVDVIDSSLRMVGDASAYIGIVSRRYGQTPICPKRNPNRLSITELEFNEAQRLGRPILLFIMGAKHPLREADFEANTKNRQKLKRFRERAKKITPDSFVHRVYATFESFNEFNEKAIHAVANLRRYLDEHNTENTQVDRSSDEIEVQSFPKPPQFYAEPPYIGSHEFLGRRAQLEILNDWASASDVHPILLFEAIGGQGKSLLTWEWTTKHATIARNEWAGRFWYSFYERGALLADFCRHALAYMTGQPLRALQKKKTVVLGEMLFRQLQSRPWLLILDGLERILVAYQRFDAAQLADDDVDLSQDQIASRDARVSIRPEDDDLLRMFAAAAPSKLLITTRLTPRILLNPSGQGIQGVVRVLLPGLRPADAEALIRSCGVNGNSLKIQDYLKRHCDCHPLVTGVVAGLVNNYLPDRGNFDRWSEDGDLGGGQLNLANLDLIQKRNHILRSALNALPEKSLQLLSMLGLISGAVDFATLCALNPHLPAMPEKVNKPPNPEDSWRWAEKSEPDRALAIREHEQSLSVYHEYERALEERTRSPEFSAAPGKLTETIGDLERRGLLQYDANARRYDLHPVVRGISAGGLRREDKERYGKVVVDYFSQQSHSDYRQAKALDELRNALHVVRTLLQMERYQQACNAFTFDVRNALTFNLEAHAEILSLSRPFFPEGWIKLPDSVTETDASDLATTVGISLRYTDATDEALKLYGASLLGRLRRGSWEFVTYNLGNIANAVSDKDRLAQEERYALLALEVAELIVNKNALWSARLSRFRQLRHVGNWHDAEEIWQCFLSTRRDWPDDFEEIAECEYAFLLFGQNRLTEEQLARAEQVAIARMRRDVIRVLHRLRGHWYLERGEVALAVERLTDAVRMAREVGQAAPFSETQLALAKLRMGNVSEARREAEQLEQGKEVAYLPLAQLWSAIGDQDRASRYALDAYKKAWADGEPYVYRYELDKASALLTELKVEIPNLSPYDSTREERLPWEDELITAVKKLRMSKKTELRKKARKQKQKLEAKPPKRRAPRAPNRRTPRGPNKT